jgi:carboxyl-terminal processing protease
VKIPLPPWFGKFARAISIALAVTAFSVNPQLSSAQSGNLTVVEFVSKTTGIYFITGRPSEQALLDSYPTLWERTGMQFQTFAGDRAVAPEVICRYQIRPTGTIFSTHFFGGTSDCALVASQNRPDLYIYEGLDFGIYQPTASGSCPAQAPVAIYRSYRFASPVNVPNHRYSVNQAAYNEMTTRGYTPEGPVFCVISATPATPRPTFATSSLNKDRCVAPRVGVSPFTGNAYPDQPGTLDNERNWMRSFTDETYLWYREVPNVNVNAYSSAQSLFAVLKSPYKTFVNTDKDEFHFTDVTADVEATSAGITYSYGIEWRLFSTSTGVIAVAVIVDAGSPAEALGVRRGDIVTAVNGIAAGDLNVPANRSRVLAAMFPSVLGQSNTFEFRRAGTGAISTVRLTSSELLIKTTPAVKVLNTPNGKVGYIALYTFNTFAAEADLFNAFTTLRNAGVTDLVVDLRYNGGGYVYISSQLAYMVAGFARTSGKTYLFQTPNDKRVGSAAPFYNITSNFVPSFPANQQLPTLNLGRVYVLTSGGSASASEAFINGLRGIDVEVNVIGSTTRGKPYGFLAQDNCGTTYYTIQFKGSNNKGQGDYITGFSPVCAARDDLRYELGDTTEEMLGVALDYRATGVCRAIASSTLKSTASTPEIIDASSVFPARYRPINVTINAERTLKENMR